MCTKTTGYLAMSCVGGPCTLWYLVVGITVYTPIPDRYTRNSRGSVLGLLVCPLCACFLFFALVSFVLV